MVESKAPSPLIQHREWGREASQEVGLGFPHGRFSPSVCCALWERGYPSALYIRFLWLFIFFEYWQLVQCTVSNTVGNRISIYHKMCHFVVIWSETYDMGSCCDTHTNSVSPMMQVSERMHFIYYTFEFMVTRSFLLTLHWIVMEKSWTSLPESFKNIDQMVFDWVL